mmetsp:Transcript_14044/g.21507  ORF Transcript_14044/g.21507 Transcript_14044/m.21507 type:complete len:100 (+) Transcript_14044:278-577(+)
MLLDPLWRVAMRTSIQDIHKIIIIAFWKLITKIHVTVLQYHNVVWVQIQPEKKLVMVLGRMENSKLTLDRAWEVLLATMLEKTVHQRLEKAHALILVPI